MVSWGGPAAKVSVRVDLRKVVWRKVETQLVEERYLGGLWLPKFQLIQLIDLRYLCGITERRE